MATSRLLEVPAMVFPAGSSIGLRMPRGLRHDLPQLLLVSPPLSGAEGDDFRHRLDEIIDPAPRSAHIGASAAVTSMLMAP